MRAEFTKQTKLAAWERAGGHCEICTAPLMTGRIQYDHIIACDLGGNNELNNCRCVCRNCHRNKTSTYDMPRIAKSRRLRLRQAGIVPLRTITAWRLSDGSIRRVSRER